MVTPVTLGLVLDRVSPWAPLVTLLGLAGVVLYRWASLSANIRTSSDRDID